MTSFGKALEVRGRRKHSNVYWKETSNIKRCLKYSLVLLPSVFTLDVNCAQILNVILQQGTGTETGKNRVRALYMYLGQHCWTVFTDVVGSLSQAPFMNHFDTC